MNFGSITCQDHKIT